VAGGAQPNCSGLGLRGAQPHLLWFGPPLLRFEPNLVKTVMPNVNAKSL